MTVVPLLFELCLLFEMLLLVLSDVVGANLSTEVRKRQVLHLHIQKNHPAAATLMSPNGSGPNPIKRISTLSSAHLKISFHQKPHYKSQKAITLKQQDLLDLVSDLLNPSILCLHTLLLHLDL